MQHVSDAVVPSRKATFAAYLNLMKPHVTVLLLGVTLLTLGLGAR